MDQDWLKWLMNLFYCIITTLIIILSFTFFIIGKNA